MSFLSYIYKAIDKRRLLKLGAVVYPEIDGWMALLETEKDHSITYRIFDESAKLIASLSIDGQFRMGWDSDVAGLFLRETNNRFNDIEQAMRYAYLKNKEGSIKTLF